MQFRNLENQEQTKPKFSRQEEIINSKTEINGIETKPTNLRGGCLKRQTILTDPQPNSPKEKKESQTQREQEKIIADTKEFRTL